MRDFYQAHVSEILPHFKEGFMHRWGFKPYTNPNEPCVFLGLYSQNDINKFLNHKSYKIVSLGGSDMQPDQLKILKDAVNPQTTFCWQAPGAPSDILKQYNIPHKEIYVAMRDYSKFSPTPLQQVFGEDRIIYTQFKTHKELKRDYYENCFTYVKPNLLGGATSMWELAHMGRRTLGGGFPNLNYTTSYKDIHHLIKLVQEEAKYIGLVRNDVVSKAQKTFIGDEWLSLNYWL